MVATTSKAICVAARAKLATIATSRDASKFFIEHKTNQPFNEAPLKAVESFFVTETRKRITGAWGTAGSKEEEFYMVVQLGHGPFGKDYEREDYVSRDQDRVLDILELGDWAPAGTRAIFAEEPTTDKSNPNWWLTEFIFRIIFWSTIETS